MLDYNNLKRIYTELLGELDQDPKRAGLIESPARMAKAAIEMFEGAQHTNADVAEMFKKEFEIGSDDLVIVKDIECFSHCEHHGVLMYDMYISIAYLPKDGKVLGLSKFGRLAQMVCRRLQVQEKIGMDICEVLQACGLDDIAVIIDAKHGCMTARGIRSVGSSTRTTSLRGAFKENSALRSEVLRSIKVR